MKKTRLESASIGDLRLAIQGNQTFITCKVFIVALKIPGNYLKK